MSEWNVCIHDFNQRKFVKYNICNEYFMATMKDTAMKCKSKEEFLKELKSECRYRYWSKCEWEIIIQEWTGRENPDEQKIDAYDQLEMNWDRFTEYVVSEICKMTRSKKIDYLR